MQRDIERLLGESPTFLQVLEDVSRVAPLNKPVLIVGERGTGKELIASRLHFLSDRWEGQYQKVNCAAISESLMESELFGHEAGAFTGATKTHQGRFERAHGGTLFLDELATTATGVQEKLLRIIEYGEFERVGGAKTVQVDVRVVAATNEDLPSLARAGKFRRDLLDRLAFDVITLPPLRERQEDIHLLADYFGVQMAKELDRELFAGFSQRVLQELLEHAWPGNLRELKNVVERSVYRWDSDEPIDAIVFDPFDSPFRPNADRPTNPSQREPAREPETAPDQQVSVAAQGAQFPLDFKQTSADFEVEILRAALVEAKHNQRKAAEILELTYHQLRGYLKKYALLDKA